MGVMAKESAIAILSGGLDSSISLVLAKKRYEVNLALTFDYGQRAAVKEIGAAGALCQREKIEHKVLSIPWLAEITKTSLVNRDREVPLIRSYDLDNPVVTAASAQSVWVPNRNGLFINIAACYADQHKAAVILTGFNREEAATFPDNSEDFAKAATGSLFFSTQVRARVESLTQSMSKEEIVREALRLDFPLEILWSCYEGGERMCGVCESCLRSKRAFEKGGGAARMKGSFQM